MKRSRYDKETRSFESLSNAATDYFRTKISTKLRTALNGFVSELQNVTQTETSGSINNPTDDNCQEKSLFTNKDENVPVNLALQNFVHSAKSQISGLLSKQPKILDENSSSNTKPFHVDPLQITISLKLQDLLCNALDNKKLDNNATNSSEVITESELQGLSHLLQDFLSSAKQKLSFSLNADLGKKPASDEIQLLKAPDKQPIQKHNSNDKDLNKKQILEHSNTNIGSDQVKNNISQSLIVKKAFQSKESHNQIPKNQQVLNKRHNLRSSKIRSISVDPISGQINNNQLFQPLNQNKSCQDKGSEKDPKRRKLISKKHIQENRNNNIPSTSGQLEEIQKSKPLNRNKTGRTEELHRIADPNSEDSARDFEPETMESYYRSDSSSLEGPSYMNSGILLLSECEQTPDFLDLSLDMDDDSDVEPVFEMREFIHSGYADPESDSDEDVVVLGVKPKTYQEITIDEDDDGEVFEKVIELEKPTKLPKDIEDLLYDCPKCDKKFRVESLLKFHVRMHSVVESHGKVASPSVSTEMETISDEECISVRSKTPRKSNSSQRHPRKEKENSKLNSKTSHKHTNRREKQSKRKCKASS